MATCLFNVSEFTSDIERSEPIESVSVTIVMVLRVGD